MTLSIGQWSFTGGIFSPDLYGRSDIPKYKTAVKQMLNAYPQPHGGFTKRGGLQFITETKYHSKTSRLIPFQFSVEQGYVLEVGDQYIRVLMDDGLVVYSPGNATDIVEAATYKWTASGSGTSEYYLELLAGGDPGLDNPEYVFEDVGVSDTVMAGGTLGSLVAGQWAYGDNDTLGYDTIYVRLTDSVDPDTKADGYLEASYIVEIVTPYLESDLSLLKYVQSADVLYLMHPSYEPRTLSRTDHDVWSLSTISFVSTMGAPTSFSGSGGSKYAITAISEDGQESLPLTGTEDPGGSFSWTAPAGTPSAEYYNIYKDGNSSGSYGFIGIADSTTFTEPSATIIPNYNITPPKSKDPFNASDDYPGSATFYEQRLVFARTNNYPQSVWGSVTGDYTNMNISSPLQDDDSYKFTINSREVNEIKWMVALNDLIIGTAGNVWKMTPGGSGDAITPSNVLIRNQIKSGVSDLQPILIENTALFIESTNEAVRDLSYSFDSDVYKGSDLTIMAKHLFDGYQVISWCYQQNPHSIVWCVRDDGTLLGLTYLKEHGVWAWHKHSTQGYFEDVACIEDEDGNNNTYAVVRRTIDGSTVRYIEKLRDGKSLDSTFEFNVKDSFYLDSGLTYDYPKAITNITKANPCVVTATGHGYSDGDYIDIDEVLVEYNIDGTVKRGMTEVNTKRYVVADSLTNSFALQEPDLLSIVDDTLYKWTASGSGTNEYYLELLAGGDPELNEPLNVYENGSTITEATVGSLSAGEWDYGDNDTLGYNTIYVRLTDNEDPDAKVNGYLKIGQGLDSTNYTVYMSGGYSRKCVTSISGLGHLEGESVAVLANGSVVPNVTVTSGAITLPERASRVHIGLGYYSDVETLEFSVDGDSGTTRDKLRGIPSIVVICDETRELFVGGDEESLVEVPMRTDELYGDPIAPFTGDKEVSIYKGNVRESRIFVRSTNPVPMTVLALIARLDFGEY